MNKAPYSFNVKVSKNHLDSLNHVNNLEYLKWVLKAAELHWDLISKGKFSDNYVWVVYQHEITYLKSAFLNDKITINTYISENKGVKSKRIVEIYKNNDLLVKAQTIWVLLNKKTMKPTRIPDEIKTLF
ncbi:MAG: acyl-CoA thioesterase [Lutibacter sp.]